ncbi:hypothetical protein JTB14_006760 [Gonioctena quinquepunctata]|nr:hypothetical protein JTB14_006760 [Gonioctena quinquepunctata]
MLRHSQKIYPKADLKEAGLSKLGEANPKGTKIKSGKVNEKNYSDTECESDSSRSHKQKARKPRNSSDVRTGADQPCPGNEQWFRIIKDEIANQAYSTINALDDLPIQQIMTASTKAAKEHWTKKYTEERQADLNACENAVDNHPYTKENQKMKVPPEITEYDKNFPNSLHGEQEFQHPKKSIELKQTT